MSTVVAGDQRGERAGRHRHHDLVPIASLSPSLAGPPAGSRAPRSRRERYRTVLASGGPVNAGLAADRIGGIDATQRVARACPAQGREVSRGSRRSSTRSSRRSAPERIRTAGSPGATSRRPLHDLRADRPRSRLVLRPVVPGEGPRATTKLVRWNRVDDRRAGGRDAGRPPAGELPGSSSRSSAESTPRRIASRRSRCG